MQVKESSNFPNNKDLLQYSYKEEQYTPQQQVNVKGSESFTKENAFLDMSKQASNLESTKNIQVQNQESQQKIQSHVFTERQSLIQQQEQFSQQKNKLKSQYEDLVQQQEKENDSLKYFEQKYQDALDIQRKLERELENKKLQLSLIKKENQNNQTGVIKKLEHKLKILQEEKLNLVQQISQQKIIHENVTTEITNIYNNNESQQNKSLQNDISIAKNTIQNLEDQLRQQDNEQQKQSNEIKNDALDLLEQKLNKLDQNLNFLKNKKNNCKCNDKDLTVTHLQNTLRQLERPVQTIIYEQTYDTQHDCFNYINRLPRNNYYRRYSDQTRETSPVYNLNTSYHKPENYIQANIFDNELSNKAYQNKKYYSSMTGACPQHDWFQQTKSTTFTRQPSLKSENIFEHSQYSNYDDTQSYYSRQPRQYRYTNQPRVRRVSRSYRDIEEPETVHERRRISQIRTSSPLRDQRQNPQHKVRTVVTNFLDNQKLNQLENNSYKNFQFSSLDQQDKFKDKKNLQAQNENQQSFINNRYQGNNNVESEPKFQSFGKKERQFEFGNVANQICQLKKIIYGVIVQLILYMKNQFIFQKKINFQ